MAIRDETLRIAADLRSAVDSAADDEVRALTQSWVRAWDGLVAEVDAAAAVIAATEPQPSIAAVRRMERARRALRHAHRSILTMLEQSNARITAAATEIVTATTTADAAMIVSQLPRGAVDAAAFDRVNPAALDAIVDRTSRQVTSITWPLADEAVDAMLRQLAAAIPAGLSPRDAARRMVRNVEGRFNGGLARALNVARTEILDAHRQAAYVSHNANADVLDGWVWTAKLDGRTCPSCVGKHGQVFALEEAGPHDHQSGRCTRTPKTKTWAALGFDQREPNDRIVTGPEWFDKQPAATQLQIVGQRRLDALRAGRITFDDMSTLRRTRGWRDSYVATPLRDLAGV